MSRKKKLVIVTAVWGGWHVSMFLDLNLRSLLAEGNFPALAENCDITYLIYTSAADLEKLSRAPAIEMLGRVMKVEFRTIPADDMKDPIAAHHALWAEAMAKARNDRSFISLMPPDVAWSNGSFGHLGRLLALGKKAIFMSFLRVESDSFAAAMHAHLAPDKHAISISGAQLVEIGFRTLHPLQAAYLRGSRYFPYHPEMMYWPVAGEGLLCRVLAREMFIFDPAFTRLNNKNLLDSPMDLADIHVVDDSDDLFAVSLTPFEKESEWYRWPRTADPAYVGQWWTEYDSWINDLIAGTKQRWHYRPVSEASWQARERGADIFLRRAAAIREGRRVFEAATRQSCLVAARLLSIAAQTDVMAHASRGRGGALVFLPTDKAFALWSPSLVERLAEPRGERDLARLIRSHYVPYPEARRPDSLRELLYSSDAVELKSAEGRQLRCTRRYGRLEVNGVNVLDPAIQVGKLHIYLIDRLLAPIVRSAENTGASTSRELPVRRPRVQPAFPPPEATPKMPPAEPITPPQYDELERAGVTDLPIPILMGFRPVTFERYGYPTRIHHAREVLRYADHNCEPEVAGLYREGATFDPVGYVNSFTADEHELLSTVRERVASATLSDFGRSVRPVSNLLAQTGPFRVMSHLCKVFGQSQLTLFEAGPGAGYLGALMAAAGHRYLSYDVTQSVYIWQHYLLRTIAGSDFSETAWYPDFGDAAAAAKVVHFPWWQYVALLNDCPIRADVVYSNSNLGEMSPLALKHLMHVSRAVLQDSPIGLFCYFSTGMTAQSSPEQIAAAFVAAGYRLAFDKPFMAYVLDERDPRTVTGAFKAGIPHYNPSGRGGRYNANEVMALKRSEAPLDAALAAWLYGWQPPYTD